jgi:hypothetical protein
MDASRCAALKRKNHMAITGANLFAAGAGQPGQQVRGVSAQYQLDATDGVAELGSGSINPSGGPSGIHPYDSGTILGHVQPGGAGEKLVNGTVQRSSQLIANNSVEGNMLVPVSGQGQLPILPAVYGAAAGLSQRPQGE